MNFYSHYKVTWFCCWETLYRWDGPERIRKHVRFCVVLNWSLRTAQYLLKRYRSTKPHFHVGKFVNVWLKNVLIKRCDTTINDHRKSCSCRSQGTHLTRRLMRTDPRSNRPPPTGRDMYRQRLGDPLCSVVENGHTICCRVSRWTWTFCLLLNWPTPHHIVSARKKSLHWTSFPCWWLVPRSIWTGPG